jgi:hypothetical protein
LESLDLLEAQWRPAWDQHRTQATAFQMEADLIHRMDQMVLVIQEMDIKDQHQTLVMASLMDQAGNSKKKENQIKIDTGFSSHSFFLFVPSTLI